MPQKIAILIGGSDLFSGLRGISGGTLQIKKQIAGSFDEIIIINYNYFLDFGRTLKKLHSIILTKHTGDFLFLYGYSKGGEVVLNLARQICGVNNVELLLTVDIANGPWSADINRQVSSNVKKNINVYQTNKVFPLRSYGLPAYSDIVLIENIDLTNIVVENTRINHSNIERLMVPQCVNWLIKASQNCR